LSRVSLLLALWMLACQPRVFAQTVVSEICPRPAAGSTVAEPEDLRAENGVLKVELTYRKVVDRHGITRYCYLSKDGREAPNLRLGPGDLLIFTLKNSIQAPGPGRDHPGDHGSEMLGACSGSKMTRESTNVHFHGLAVPPVCHQDDVLNTIIQPSDPPFEYRLRIPDNQPPGLYWYHPHVHGLTKEQVLGGASGALIVEGIERANTDLAGLPERVLIVRDQDLLNPNAVPSASGQIQPPPVILDHDGDAVNTGTGTGRPAKDLSLNFVPVPYPNYPPGVVEMRPGERQLWRVLNASAITYLNLQLVCNGVAQPLGVVALDGVPINENGVAANRVIWQNHLALPPGGRIEFIAKGPPLGAQANLITRSVNTGWAGENDPTRPLATIVAKPDAPEPRSRLAESPTALPLPRQAWLGNVAPVRVRRLYFSETLQDPNDPNSPTTYYLTVDGQTPKAFEPNSNIPNIITHQGDVEDWIIENRTREVHAFHIHQVHFMLLSFFGLPVNEPFLRDTINVPFWNGTTSVYPIVKLRMDFRDPNSVGTFVYHCHLLEHEDGGMMGLIRVDPPEEGQHQELPAHVGAGERQLKLCGSPGKTALSFKRRQPVASASP